jgi:hypothetical protein
MLPLVTGKDERMSQFMKEENPWVWVVVRDIGENEHFLGIQRKGEKFPFIPMFLKKEAANECVKKIVPEKGVKLETQTIRYEDLAQQAAQNGFMIFLLDGAGEILEKISP